MEFWRVIENPAGDVYKTFIKVLCDNSDKFYFVTREELDYNELILQKFEPYRIRECETKEWSGTITGGSPATIHEIEVNRFTKNLLLGSAKTLYDWVAPELPEDLTFYQKDFIWFSSTTHEEMADFRFSAEHQKKLMQQIQGLKVEKAEYYPMF